jgi:hypothetical protein
MKELEKILDNDFQQSAIEQVNNIYNETISEYRSDVNEDYENSHLSDSFQIFFKEAIFNKSLDKYSDENWYWLKLIEKLVYLIYLHEELVISDSDFELSETEDELFNFWHDSDYAKSFLNMINESKDLLSTSKFHLSLLEGQIMGFFALQISTDINFDEVSYYNVPELGDGHDRLFVSKAHKFYNLRNKDKERFIFRIRCQENKVYANDEHMVFSNNEEPLEDGTYLHMSSVDLDNERERIKENIVKALSIINEANPKLYKTFKNFTKVVVPINEKGIVSYSMQSLPGFSSINMFERDFLDLLDDLLHENGHHYMNHFLNVDELLNEDDEKIYYSPWRRALRPVRGIYHAYFTFYWAFILYKSLYIAQRDNKITSYNFSDSELNKIMRRTLEEYYMIDFCWSDLEKAHKADKISDEGMKLISFINDDLKGVSVDFVTELEADLKNRSIIDFEKVAELKHHLNDTSSHYEAD